MRTRIVAGNWKMNTLPSEGVVLAKEINQYFKSKDKDAKIIICPPYTHLYEIANQIDQDNVELGAQNCSSEKSGAYTGEISADMLKNLGVKWVIIGHSERRSYYNESDEILFEKVQRVFESELNPIFCCGEVLEQRNNKNHFKVVKTQLENVVFKLNESELKKMIIAYEPVWAIGTGITASPGQAQEMHAFIRKTIAEKFGNNIAESIPLLYGGSCKPNNAKELFGQDDVDGGLIGGASLKANDFIEIVKA